MMEFFSENSQPLTIFSKKLFSQTLRKKCPYSELFWSSFFPHFPAFGLNTERYSVESRQYPSVFTRNVAKCGKNADQNSSKYGHFLCSEMFGSVINTSLIVAHSQNMVLEKKRNFPLRIFSVHVTKSTISCGFGHIY